MTSNFHSKTLSPGTSGVLVVPGDGTPYMLSNLDTTNTITLNDDSTILASASNADQNTGAPLPPLATICFDGKAPVFATANSGNPVLAIVPGSTAFYQFLSLVVRNLVIAAGGSIQGTNWILDQQGYKQYNGSPTLGNLIQSWTPTSGTDTFGNPFAGGKQNVTISGNGQTIPTGGLFIRVAVGGASPGTWTNNGALAEHSNVSSFSLTPAAVGDLVLVAVAQQSNKTVTATALASTNATWTLLGTFKGSNNTRTIALFQGVVSAASAATVTVTWSGTAPAVIRIATQEFTSSTGSFSQDGSIATMDVVTAQTNWPVMSPGAANELYWGYNIVQGTVTNGTQPDFVYTKDASGNTSAYNLATAQPSEGAVWGSASQQFGATLLMRAGSGPGNWSALILQPGSQDGQQIQVVNIDVAATLTFDIQTTSNVAGGTSNQLSPLSGAGFVWSQQDLLWYPL